jgi:hypothetical protein
VAAALVCAVHQEAAHASGTHFGEGDFLAGGVGWHGTWPVTFFRLGFIASRAAASPEISFSKARIAPT